MHVIAVSNRKGGTGKTTVSVNLAAEFAALGQRVLLIDLDSQGHCGVGLGICVRLGDPNVHRLFIDPKAKFLDAVQPTFIENLWLAPADPLFDHGSGVRDDRRLKHALANENIANSFDIVVIDTPPSFDTLLVNALIAATRVLIPYVPHHLSYEGIRQLTRALFRIMTRENRDLKILGFLPTMSAAHIRQHREVAGQVSHEFGALKALVGIRNDIRLAESFATGLPIRYYAPKSRGAEDFASLARELIAKLV